METNHIRVLKELARKSPRTSRSLAEAVGAWKQPHPRGMVRVNAILTAEARRGHTRTVGKVPSSYNNTPAFLWEITPAGREWLDAGTWKVDHSHAAMSAEQERRRAHRSALLEHLDREARINDWGMDTSVEERRAAIIAMRELGCSLQAVGDVFGITAEYARLIVIGSQKRGGVEMPLGKSGKVNRRGHWVRLENTP
jgi:hypothetical protein